MAEGIDPVSLEDQRKQAVDRLFTEEVADEDQRKSFRQQSWDMTQPPPDQAGEALQLGSKFGVPRKAVEADPEYWKRRDQEAHRKLLQEASPRTMAWLDDEDNYAVAKDDLDILGQIESTFSKIGYAAKGGAQRFMATGVAAERQSIGETMEFYRRRDEWEAREERRKKLGQDAPRGWRTIKTPQVGSIGAREIPYWYGETDAAPGASGIIREEVRKALPESMRPMFASQVGMDDAKAVRGVLERRMDMVDARARAKVEEFTETLEKAQTGNYVADGLLSGVTSLTEMAPSMAAFFVMRGRGGATVGSIGIGAQVAGAEYLEGIYNLNLSERDASDRALLQAGVEVVTERISLGYLDELMKSDRGFVSKLALSMGQEQVQEQAATLGNRLVDIPYIAPDMTVGQFLAETPAAAGQTALATLVASGVTNATLIGLDTAVRDMVERSVLSQPSAGDAAIDAVLKKAKDSRLGKRSPEKLKDILDRQAAGTGVETVIVDLDELAQTLKEKGVEVADALDGLGVPRDELQQKWERFGEIEIKLADLATSDLMRGYGAETQAHTRRTDDAYTPARKAKMREALEPEIQEQAKKIYDDLQNGADLADREQEVADRVRQRLRGAGILAERAQEDASVAIQTAMVTTLARRMGADPVEFFDQHYPRVQGSIDGMVSEEGAFVSQSNTDTKGIDFTDGYNRLSRGPVEVEYVVHPGGRLEIESMYVEPDARGKGEASRALDDILAAADKKGLTVDLTVDALDDGGLSDSALEKFYERRGFVTNSDGAMVRQPKTPDMVDSGDLFAQLIGPKATSANKAILDTAKKMAKEKVKDGKGLLARSKPKYTRQQIWDKTAEMGQPWYQDADGQWISEIEDGVIVVKEAKGKLNEVIEFPTLYAEYPDLTKMRADARDKVTAKEDGVADVPGTKGTFNPRPIFGAHVRISDRGANSREYTVTHELQHAVDHLEGRKMGMNKKYLYRQTERRAFNTMYRRLWTMEERIATPPWKTEQEAIDWMMGMRDMNADPARFGKEGTYDPGPVLPEPETTAVKPSADQNVPQGAVNRDLAMPEEVVQRSWHLRPDGSLAPAKFRMMAPPTALLGRTFLSVRDLLRSAAKNEQIAEVIGKASVTEADVRAAVAADVRAIFEKHAQYQKERPQENEAEIWIDAVEAVDTSVLANIGYSGELAEAIYYDGLEAGLTERQIVERFTDQFMQSPQNFDYAATSLAGKRSVPRTRSEENRAVKEVEAALAEKLLDMDKSLDQQATNARVFFETMIAEQQSREDLITGEYDQARPGYFDGLAVNELIRELSASQADESGIRDPMIEMIRRLRASGIVGARYTPGGIREDGPPQTQSIVIFDERAPVLLTDPSGNLMQQRRGQFSPSRNVITMFEAADVTTLMHEGAHWYLAEIERMASAEGAHPFVVEQWEAVKKWGKVGPDFRMYDDMGRVTEEGRELQEAFAETFEVYLQTGKAPVPSLREAFRAFKQWITALWRDIRTGKIRLPERANLSPEITRVMDRMLAVDEEIESQTAEVVTKAEAMANDLYDRGIITKRQRDAAVMNLDEAREAAKEDLMAQIMQAELRVREAQISAKQRRIKGDVTREYDRSTVGRALSWLGYGQWKGDVPVSETEGRDSEVEFYQSIRTATTMPMEDIHAWVVENVATKIQEFPSGDEGAMMSWRLSDAPDAPRVLLSIRLNRKGRADVNLFLDNKMADALDGVSDPVERSRIAMEMFSQAVMVMRQYSAETPDLKAFNFIAAENEKAGRKAKSREELYRFLLSTMRMDGYTAYEIGGQTSVVRQADGVKSADPLFNSAGFVMIRDGVDVDEFARNEILRGRQSGGDAGEIVTALTAVRLSRAPRGRVDRGRPEAGGADPRSVVGDTLGQDELTQRGDPKGWGETAPPPDLPPMRLDLEAVRQLYGEDAVRRLPRAIRDRSRDKTSIDGMIDIIRASAKTLKRKPPPTLLQYIRSRKARTVAGQTVPIKKWGIKGAADELKAMNREDLINEENGIAIDYVRESAAEAGYLAEDATINDLLNAIDREARGEPVYSRYDQKEVEDQRFAKEWADWLGTEGIDIFETDMKKLKAQAAKVVTSTAADAVTPDQAAEMLGFPTGEDLLNVLSLMGNREQWVREETDRRLREEFGDPMADGTFEEEARVIAEAEVMSRAAEIEMEALARAVGEPAASKLAKEMAMESLGLMTVKELEGWERFLNAERREMNNTLEAVRRGDMVQAFIHKRRQLVNIHLARAAREKSQAIEKTRKDMLSYYSSKGRRDKIAPDYLEKIEALLEGYELRVSKQGPGEQKRRMSAKEYVDQMIADGREAEIAPEAMMLAEMAGNKVWRGLTADEVDYLAGTVRNLAHLGRTKGRLMREQEKRRFDAVVAELVDTLMASPSSRPRGKSFSPGAVEEVTTRASQFDAKLTKIQDELELLDGREAGPLQTTLLLPMEQADVRKSTMMRGAIKEIRRLWNDVPAQLRRQTLSRRVATPELKLPTNENMTLMDVVIIGLNWGNAGNRQALIDGYGWTPASVEAVLDRYLTNEHWQFIEGVWSLIGSYKTDAFALEKRITGVEPKAVEGITFTLPSGRVVKGQYYPLKYDADQESALSVKQQKLDEKQMLSEMGLSFSKPMTKTGHLISRVGSGGKPVKVSIDVFYEHVENVVHDIAFRPAVIDAFKIIRDPRFTQAYIDAAGKAQYDRLLPWLHSIATNNRARFSSTFARTMTFFRGSWSIAIMGYSFSTATQQLTGYVEAGTEIGGRWVIQGALKSLSMGPASFWREWAFIRDRSEYLSNRVAFGKERDIRAVRTRATIGGPLTPIGDNAFVFLSVMDAIVGTAVWRGAYDKAMAGKVNGIAKGEEDAAIAYADRAVQRSLSSGETYALPEIMREGEISALMTMVYSYGSKTYNRQRVRNMKLRQGRIGVAEFTINTLIAFTAVPILAALLAGRLWPDDEEEWEERGDDVGNEILMNAAGTTPFVRDIITLLAKPQYGYQLSPVQSTFEQIGVATRSAAEGKTFDSEYQTKQAVMAISTIFRLPGGQLFETGDYVYDLYMGNEDPLEDPADAAREAFIRSER